MAKRQDIEEWSIANGRWSMVNLCVMHEEVG